MAKKGNGFGKLVAFATIAGAVAAGISILRNINLSIKNWKKIFMILKMTGMMTFPRLTAQ